MAALLLLVAICWAGTARAEDVAITFDDLPIASRTASIKDASAITHRLLARLQRHHIPATGFVNEIQLEGPGRGQRIALLEAWLKAGLDLGNHTYSHPSLTNTPVETYIADVERGETVTRSLLARRGIRPRWFRHPYLETGPSLEVRYRFEQWLADHGYRVAPVTMENSDWMFALPYDDAVLRHENERAREIRAAYLAFTASMIAWYENAGSRLLGRPMSFVFLLHASRLNADALDGLSQLFRNADLHPVSLDRAMSDPAYTIPDDYVGPDGDQWLTRWARTLHRDLPWASLPRPPADIVADCTELDGDSGSASDSRH